MTVAFVRSRHARRTISSRDRSQVVACELDPVVVEAFLVDSLRDHTGRSEHPSEQCRPDPGGELGGVLKETEVIAGYLEERQAVAFGKNHAGPCGPLVIC
jgi:hypothetical protein